MISSKFHGILDYITVIIFALAPSVFALSKTGVIICYILAGVHFVMTIFTGFSASLVRAISFKFHGFVELIVGFVLAIVPWLIGDVLNPTDQLFFCIMGVIILIVRFSTNYQSPLEESGLGVD